MKTFTFYFFAAAIIAAMSACNKNGLPAVSHSSKAADTAVDVYVAGTISANGNFVAAYWKNGILIKATDTVSTSWGNDIAVHGGEVYLAGYITPPLGSTGTGINQTKAAYWKNGVPVILNNSDFINSQAGAIAFKGDDMFIVGTANKNSLQQTAVYWQNGIITTLPNSEVNSGAQAIAVNGNDVYIAGYNAAGGVY